MRNRLTTLLAIGVLSAGAAGALLFRKQAPIAAPTPQAAPTLVLRDHSGPHFLTPVGPPAQGQPPEHAAAGPDAKPSPPLASLTPFDEVDPVPPAIEWKYPGDFFSEPPAPVQWREAPAAPSNDATPAPVVASDVSTAAAATGGEQSPVRRHTIVDGDTLASLAQRYLGDKSRQREIYDLNRDVLHDPELLPIGQELKIPAAP